MGKDIPRSASICQYVLELPREQLISNNIREDSRNKHFHKMPMAPNIQFYTGTPIITTRGYTVGTLCVIDKIPGSINHEQKEGLRLLSDQLSNLFVQQLNTPDKLSNITLNDNHEKMIGTYYSSASILFTDFVGFTELT
jgi:GAF domain-containing protein